MSHKALMRKIESKLGGHDYQIAKYGPSKLQRRLQRRYKDVLVKSEIGRPETLNGLRQ